MTVAYSIFYSDLYFIWKNSTIPVHELYENLKIEMYHIDGIYGRARWKKYIEILVEDPNTEEKNSYTDSIYYGSCNKISRDILDASSDVIIVYDLDTGGFYLLDLKRNR